LPGIDPVDECEALYRAGCDGLFADFPATAGRARARWLRAQRAPAPRDGLRVVSVVGAGIAPYLPALAALRIRVFREWPYLYEGDLQYEADYLRTYSESARSLFVLAFDGDEIVGCSTGLPLVDETPACQAPFLAASIDVQSVFYFGESVLDPAYRGLGLGHRFFDAREAYARELGTHRLTAFCAVARAASDPRRPPDQRPLDAFWQSRGYQRRPDLVASFEWRELGQAEASAKPMVFWLRELHP
jgi:GNAT superfamily N-acetyltransferase